MQIQYLSNLSFKLSGKEATAVLDPEEKNFKSLKADLAIFTHEENAEKFRAIDNENVRYTIGMPGEYEVGGITVFGFDTKERNIIYVIEADGLKICHLGDLNHKMSDKLLEKLGEVDILLLPVGEGFALESGVAVEMANQLEPFIVIPMYSNDKDLDAFKKEIGAEQIESKDKLSVTPSSLPEEMQIIALSA